MAFAGRAVLKTAVGGDVTRLRRLGLRFTRPLLPGGDLVTRIWVVGSRGGRTVLVFEMDDEAGAGVVRLGRAEVLV